MGQAAAVGNRAMKEPGYAVLAAGLQGTAARQLQHLQGALHVVSTHLHGEEQASVQSLRQASTAHMCGSCSAHAMLALQCLGSPFQIQDLHLPKIYCSPPW